jgi:hypothetical protein
MHSDPAKLSTGGADNFNFQIPSSASRRDYTKPNSFFDLLVDMSNHITAVPWRALHDGALVRWPVFADNGLSTFRTYLQYSRDTR